MRSLLVAILAVAGAARTARADDPLYTCKEAAPTARLVATFKPDSSVHDLVAWVMGFSCRSVIVASDVPKHVTKVTIYSPGPMSPKQALQLFVDALEATGLTVVVKPDTIIVSLGPKFPRGCPDAPPAKAAPPAPTVPAPDPLAQADEDHALIDAAVQRIDDTHANVSRGKIAPVLARDATLARGARVVPAVKDGQPDGIKLYAVRPSSIYAKLGLTNGDTLQGVTVDGGAHLPLDTVEHALAAYDKVKAAKKVVVLDLVRRGTPLTLVITVVP
ncbi:MAG: hypothetical protein KIT31_31615 [Deltaproteobacteria bacterium]|nr:hypothetical protein [Deltaproteobacteria bacterium]